jgi:hypothetical protein
MTVTIVRTGTMLPGTAVNTRNAIRLFRSHAVPYSPEPTRNPTSALTDRIVTAEG